MGANDLSLAANLRRLRTSRGLTQQELAAPAYSPAYISTIEAGKRAPSARAIRHLASKLGVDPEELVTGKPQGLEAQLELQLHEARVALSHGRVDQVLRILGHVDAEARRFNLLRQLGKVRFLRGLAAERTGRTEEALVAYEEAEELLRAEAPTARADATAAKARCVQHLGDTLYAIYLLESLIDELVQKELLDPEALVKLYAPLSFAYFEAGLYKKAAEAATEALRLSDRVADPVAIGMMHVNVARVFLQQGHSAEAEASLLRAEDLFDRINLGTELGRAHLAHGYFLSREGRLEEARQHLALACDIFKSTGSALDQARAQTELARIERVESNVRRAVELLESSMQLLRSSEHVAELALAHRELALCHLESDAVVAEKNLRQALSLYERADQAAEVAATYRILGDLMARAGDDAGSAEAYRSGIMALDGRL